MIYYLFITIFLGFELQKLFNFNFFFRIRMISVDYSTKIMKKTKSIAYKEITKIALIDIVYLILVLIGLFTINRYFFSAILILSVLNTIMFKIKNKTFKKIYYILDILISIILLSLVIINFTYYQLDSVQFLKHIYSLWQFR